MTLNKNKMRLTQNDIILISAMELSDGDTNMKFTAEELLIQSWQNDKTTFGLRGFEKKYPDSNILYTKLMGKSGLIRKGLLKKIGEKTYTITEAGLSIASSLNPTNDDIKLKIDRQLNDAIIKIINHPVFIDWIKTNGEEPKKFRDAMWFWGIAPGIPSKVAKERLSVVEKNLLEAKNKCEKSGGKITIDVKGISNETKDLFYDPEKKGKLSISSTDIERCFEFHNELKDRFKNELMYIIKNS